MRQQLVEIGTGNTTYCAERPQMLSSIALTLTLAMQEQVDVGAPAAFSSYVAGQRWDFVVSHEDIGNSPRWLDTDDSDWSPDSQRILYAIGPAQPDVVERAEGVTA